MAKKNVDEKILQEEELSLIKNPLLNALRINDKKNLFSSNVVTEYLKTGFHLFDYYFGSVINVHDKYGALIRQEPRIGQAMGTFNMVVGRSGCGKMEPNSRKIPTPVGYIKMGDLEVGDVIFGSDGGPIKVEEIFPHNNKAVYQVKFHDGRVAECGLEHLWEVKSYDGKRIVLPLCEIMKDYEKTVMCEDGTTKTEYKYSIPLVSRPVQYIQQKTSIAPYSMGVIFMSCDRTAETFTIISENDYVPKKLAELERIRAVQPNPDVPLWEFHYKDTNIPIKTKTFFQYIKEFKDLSEELTLPPRYIYNSVPDRLAVLNGIFDVSAEIRPESEKSIIVIDSLFEDQARIIMELLYGMGLVARLEVDEDNTISTGQPLWKILIHIPNGKKCDYFTIPSKYYQAKALAGIPDDVRMGGLMITNIKYLRNDDCRCIRVSSKDSLYLTQGYIVTHNTTLTVQASSNIIRQFKNAHIIHYDCEQRMDISRLETISKLPAHYFRDEGEGARYIIKAGAIGLDVIQESIVKLYVQKMKLKDQLTIDTGKLDEFGKPVTIMEPTIIIIDSITSVLSETFSPDNAKESSDAEKLRSNTDGARDSKTLKGFLKDVLPLCKEAGITIYGINHINSNMSVNSFIPPTRQQNYMKQDETMPGGRALIFYSFNIIKMIAKPSDSFTEESDGFDGYIVSIEPVKSSSNQSGNESNGVSFDMVFSFRHGFDPLRTLLRYAKDRGILEGNKARMKFRDDPETVFSMKEIYKEISEKPKIMENIKTYIFPVLRDHLPFVDPSEMKFDNRLMDY